MNPHREWIPHWILSPARLPIPPPRLGPIILWGWEGGHKI